MPAIERTCASSYVQAAIGIVEDRICRDTGKLVELSANEVLDCDATSRGCKGGNSNRVFTWGKRKGFITKECYQPAETGKCP